MTIEEEIQRQEEQAMAYKSMGNMLSMNISTEKQFRAMECYQMSEHHRQLAEWLRELKAYREELPKEIKNAKVRQANALEANVKNENYNSHLAEYIKGYLCGLSYTEGIIAKILEEGNADG